MCVRSRLCFVLKVDTIMSFFALGGSMLWIICDTGETVCRLATKNINPVTLQGAQVQEKAKMFFFFFFFRHRKGAV